MRCSRAVFGGFSGAILARAALVLAVLVLVPGLAPRPAASAELVMFERAGCPWCLRWKQEIGPVYPRTEEGRRAPLRHVSLDRGPPVTFQLAEPVFYTPTFVLLNDEGREVGRLTGYIGEEAFWGLLGGLVAKLGPKAATAESMFAAFPVLAVLDASKTNLKRNNPNKREE